MPAFTPAVVWYWRSREQALQELDQLLDSAPVNSGKEVWLYGAINESSVAKCVIDSAVTDSLFRSSVRAFVDGLATRVESKTVENRPANHASIDVIVPSTFRRLRELERCIRSILASNYADFSIIIVRSGTGTGELPIDITSDERVRCVHEPTFGKSRAANKGLSVASAPYVAFTDDDVTVEADWLAEIVSVFTTQADTACVTGLVIPAEVETLAQARFERHVGGLAVGFSRLRFHCARPAAIIRRVTMEMGANNESRTVELPMHVAAGNAGVGANMAFRRVDLPGRNPFDKNLGPGTPTAGGEEIRLFVELLAAGKVISYVPTAVVRHYHRRSCKELMEQIRGYGVGVSATLLALTLSDFRFSIEWLVTKLNAPPFYRSNNEQSNRMFQGLGGADDSEIRHVYWSGVRSGPLSYLSSRYHKV